MTEREKPRPCYRDRDNGVRFIKNAHHHECADPDCRGCTVCPETRHCTARRNCSWHLPEEQLTCGRCIRSVRLELGWIVSISALLLTQAIADGLDSQATNLAGPAVDPEAWSWRKAAARAHRATGRAWHVSLIEDDDEHHPLRVLGTWERMIREDYDQPADDPATIAGAAGYLNRNLYRIANDEHQDFGLLRAELKKCRQHLESVLHNDDRLDRGAPCPTCASARREEAKAAEEEGRPVEQKPLPRLQRHYAHWCQDEDCEARFHYVDDSADVWQCPRNPEHWWTQQGYADLLMARRSA